MNFRKAIILVVFLLGSGIASAKAPKAPSNLRVKPLGANSFLMEWQDNSKNETGWEIRVSLGNTSTPKRFLLVPSPDITSYVVLTNNVHGKTLSFQIAAYNGATGLEKISKPTSAVTVTALDSSTFGKPLDLTAKPLDDGRIRISWKDKSTTEEGYQIQYRKGSGKWKAYGTANPDVKFSLPAGTFEPENAYSFRVRAFKQNPPVFTPFSNVATAKTLPFQAPSGLTAASEGEGKISLKWKDRSAIEAGYEIQRKAGTGDFSTLGDVGANVSSTSPIAGAFDTDYQFRIRAFRLVKTARVYTGFSKVISAKSTPLAKPTDLAITAVTKTSATLTWKDASDNELGYQIQYRQEGDADFSDIATAASNATTYTATGLTPGKTYEFQVRAIEFFSASAFTSVVRATTQGGSLESGDADPPIFWNSSFVYQFGVTSLENLLSIDVTGLPAGLAYNASTRTISGTTTEEGVKTVAVKAKFNGGDEQNVTLTLRIIRAPSAPVAKTAFAPVQVAAGNTSPVSITGKFADPDTGEARRVTTTLGSFDIILYPLATPGTVNNFLRYADDGLYNSTFFHRSIDDFIVQGGGYSHNGTSFSKVVAFPAIQNEPGISNVAGTVAMAKIGGQPNSATSEFFVNLNDLNAHDPNNPNGANLDEQNEGFSVFGRIAGTGMNVVNQINALPSQDYTVTVDGSSRRLDDVPMNVAPPVPAVMDPTKLVKVTSVAPVPILRYEVTSGDPAIATAVVNGTNVDITGVATGTTTITVKAIDLDGQMVSQTIPLTVP
jgi:cyclophilin family peptidyl-prolyl cis-trans isomerase